MTPEEIQAPVSLPYGKSEDQHIDVWDAGAEARGTIVLIHGGYWRARFTSELMAPLCAMFLQRGWNVVNVEYRRVGTGGGWPATADDVDDALEGVSLDPDLSEPVILIGHSVGGQLALLSSDLADVVVALAPVTDLERGYREGNGEKAVVEFMGASPTKRPDAYAAASPLRQLPPASPVLIVHGTDDTRVPIEHTHVYMAACRSIEADVTFVERANLSHMELINPRAKFWPSVLDWIDSRTT